MEELNIKVIYTCRQNYLVVAVTGDETGSFQTVKFDLFKLEKRNYLSLSLNLNADSVCST